MDLVNPNLDALAASVRALEPMLQDLVFVGGAIAGLLIDDPGASQARPTRDVDVVAKITGAKGYLWASKAMGQAGFQPDTSEGAPICRWAKDGLLVDLMGTDDTPFGTTNPWYAEGFRTRKEVVVRGTGLSIFILSGPLFLLTKWVAYQGRGQGSMMASHDIEDMLNLLDGRLELEEEAREASPGTRAALAQMAEQMLSSEQFCDYCLESLGERKEFVEARLKDFRSLG